MERSRGAAEGRSSGIRTMQRSRRISAYEHEYGRPKLIARLPAFTAGAIVLSQYGKTRATVSLRYSVKGISSSRSVAYRGSLRGDRSSSGQRTRAYVITAAPEIQGACVRSRIS